MVPSAPPSASAPTSPMNTCAGCVLNQRKARPAPAIAAQKISSSPAPGMCGKSRYLRVDRAAGHVGEHAERRADHHHRHDRQAVEAVGEVHRVAGADDHEVGQRDEAEHAERIADVLEERHASGRPWAAGSGREAATAPRRRTARSTRKLELSRNAERQVERGERCRSATARNTSRASACPPGPCAPPCASRRPSRSRRSRASRPARSRRSGCVQSNHSSVETPMRDQDQHAAHGRRAALDQVRLHAVAAHRLADLQRGQARGSPTGPTTRPISSAVIAAITARKVMYWNTRRKPNSGLSVCSHWPG